MTVQTVTYGSAWTKPHTKTVEWNKIDDEQHHTYIYAYIYKNIIYIWNQKKGKFSFKTKSEKTP